MVIINRKKKKNPDIFWIRYLVGTTKGLDHRFRTRSLPRFVLRPAAIFVNYVYNVKITQYFMPLATPLIVTLPRVAREPAHTKESGPVP
jgi:hypothetical protein